MRWRLRRCLPISGSCAIMRRMAYRVRVDSPAIRSVIAGAGLLLACETARGDGASSQKTVRTVRVVTDPDGTKHTSVTETTTVTKNGRSTSTTKTTELGPGSPEPTAPPAPPAATESADALHRPGKAAALSGSALVAEALAAHNEVRKKVGVPGLAWDEKLAKFAQEWGRHLCRGGKQLPTLVHRQIRAGSPGENLWEGASTLPDPYTVSDAVKSWASENKYFDVRGNRCRGGVCGHYTQLVWRDTTHVGCAVAACAVSDMTATIWVCNYSPGGNVIGERPY